MYKYVKRELELLQLPALGQDLGDGGDQVDLPLVADLVETRGDGHVGQTVTEIVEVSKYLVQSTNYIHQEEERSIGAEDLLTD